MSGGRPPTRADLEAARDKTLPEVIAPDLRVLFCGINPGLYTAAVGHHFGMPGDRFWRVLHESGFTPRRFHPSDQRELLDLGYGITNVVARATAAAGDLTHDELIEGGSALKAKVAEFHPTWLAPCSVSAPIEPRSPVRVRKSAAGKSESPIRASGRSQTRAN